MAELQAKSPAPFPSWIGPAWLFIVFIGGGDWDSVLLYGGIPWLVAWLVWRQLARSELFLAMPSETVDAFWHGTGIVIWTVVVILCGGIYYVNHYMPRGLMVDTGNVVCENDDRGPCGEGYREDVSGLPLSDWLIFLKSEQSLLLVGGLVMAGIFASSRPRGGYGHKGDN